METRSVNQVNNSSTPVSSFIFAEHALPVINNIIRNHLTTVSYPDTVWLLRESSVAGLLTVSHFNRDKQRVEHFRLGLVNDWQKITKDRDNATLFAKNLAKPSFANSTSKEEVEQLKTYLESLGFKSNNMILPSAQQATRTAAYTAYTTELGNDNYRSQDNNPADRYNPF